VCDGNKREKVKGVDKVHGVLGVFSFFLVVLGAIFAKGADTHAMLAGWLKMMCFSHPCLPLL
jgi:hypothetical protein